MASFSVESIGTFTAIVIDQVDAGCVQSARPIRAVIDVFLTSVSLPAWQAVALESAEL